MASDIVERDCPDCEGRGGDSLGECRWCGGTGKWDEERQSQSLYETAPVGTVAALRSRVAELEAALGTIIVLIAGSPEQIPDWSTARDIRNRARRALDGAGNG